MLATGATFWRTFLSAPLPGNAGEFAWWYPQDGDRQVDSAADGSQQTTVRISSGQWQGFAIGIFNTSEFTETIIGPPAGARHGTAEGGPRFPADRRSRLPTAK